MSDNEMHMAMASAALVALAQRGIPADLQELLIYGDPMRGIAPGALSHAIQAALKAGIQHKQDT